MLIERLVPGSKWGRWTVLLPCFTDEGVRRVLVECECGTQATPRAYSVMNGSSKQCVACRRRGLAETLRTPDSGWNTYYYRYQTNAKNRGLSFDISKEQFRSLCEQECYYCGDSPEQRTLNNHRPILANGVDRVDSSAGYQLENCVTCCGMCNKMKLNYGTDEFLEKIQKISRKHGLKK